MVAAGDQQQQQVQVMAVLGADAEAFESLMGHLMSASNEQRGQAESVFNQCKVGFPDRLVSKLVFTLRTSLHLEVRAMSAVLLRKLITKDDGNLWSQLTSATQMLVKSQLLLCVQQEHDKSILKKLSDTVAELAAGIMDEGLWPELLPFMFQCVSSGTERLQGSALHIFAQLAQYVGPQLRSRLATLHTVLRQCLASSTSGDVRIAALRATTNFIQTLGDSDELERFQDLLPGMMQTLALALNSNEEATAQEALEMFIEVAGTEPAFLRRQLVDVVSSMLQVAESCHLEEGTRHLAVEFLITLAEARERAPGMMRKLPQFIVRLFASLMNMLLDIEDELGWHAAATEDEDAGYSSNFEVGQECLDRLAISLGGNTVLPLASQLLPSYISNEDWKKRHAALITLAQIAEGCSKGMIKSLDPVLTMVLSSFQDPHPRVRWAAINAVGQLSTDLGPDLQQGYHRHVVLALIGAMDDCQNPRIQAHAAAAILNFSESCAPDILALYLDSIVSKLLVLLQNGNKIVQEGALTALASVADSSQGFFEKYYDIVMPYLKAILLNANDRANRMLRAKSMECISLVGMAVGKEKFRADAKQVMEVLMNLQGAHMEDDDPTISYMLQAWARLCKCLGHEFLPYMSVVMPPLLKSAQLKPDVMVMDADSEDDGDESDGSMETITVGDKKIGIRTSVLEEKATACNMLCCYADELKEGFYPWIDQVAAILVPLLKFYFHEEVRKAAVSAMPVLLQSGKLAVEKGHAQGRDPAYVKQFLDYIVAPLIEALHKEPETEICASILESLNECLQISGDVLDSGQIASIVEELKQVIIASDVRKKKRSDRTKTEDFDDEEGELLEEENQLEEEVFEQVGECLGTLIKTFKGAFLPYFEELLAYLIPMLDKDRSPEERRVVICLFDDVAEQTRNLAVKYYGTFLPSLLEASTDINHDVRQAAVYGIGVCAEFGGHSFQPVLSEALQRLTGAITDPSAYHPDSIMATDNAVSALGKICEHQSDGMDTSQVVSAWLNCLPLRGDLVEAKIVHEQLCSMVERSHVVVLGPSNCNILKIMSIFIEILSAGTELVNIETAVRLKDLLRQLQHTSASSSLQPHQQVSLQSILASYN